MSRSSTSPVRRGLLLVSLAAVAWGTSGAAAEIIERSGSIGPVGLSFWRCAGGFALLLPVHLIRRRLSSGALEPTRPVAGERRRRVLRNLLSGAGLAVFQAGYVVAVQLSGLAVATLVTLGASPVLVAAGGRVLLGQRLGRAGTAALVGALAGLCLVVLGGTGAGAARPYGVAAAVSAALGYTWITLLPLRLPEPAGAADPLATTVWSFGAAALWLVPAALRYGLAVHTGHPLPTLLVLAYLVAVPTALGYVLFFTGLPALHVSTAALLTLLEPVTAVLLAVGLLGERPTPVAAAGMASLLAAVGGRAVAEFRGAAPATAPPATGPARAGRPVSRRRRPRGARR